MWEVYFVAVLIALVGGLIGYLVGRYLHDNKLLANIGEHMSALTDAVAAVAADQKRISDDVTKVIGLLTQPNPDVAAPGHTPATP